MPARIAGVGKCLPHKIFTNADLERMVETSDEWIRDRTGIRERRIAADNESAATLGAGAARMALETAGATPEDVDLIICATCSPDGFFPATASLIQDAIDARRAAAFDVNAACNGFMAAFATACQFINSGVYSRVLVVGTEVLSRIVDWKDRTTCVLFGDGAGAVLLEFDPKAAQAAVVLKSDGSGARYLYARGPASPAHGLFASESYCIVMDGREVFRFAVRAMEDVARQAVAEAGLSIDDIRCVVPHQANQRIISAVGRALGLPPERVFSNVERYGNTSSASIPVALCEAWEEGRLQPGDRLLLVAFGGGLSWGAAVVEWTGVGVQPGRARNSTIETPVS